MKKALLEEIRSMEPDSDRTGERRIDCEPGDKREGDYSLR